MKLRKKKSILIQCSNCYENIVNNFVGVSRKTEMSKCDEHLRSEDFFVPEKFFIDFLWLKDFVSGKT